MIIKVTFFDHALTEYKDTSPNRQKSSKMTTNGGQTPKNITWLVRQSSELSINVNLDKNH